MVYPIGFFSAILMDAANRCGLSDSSFQIITAWNDLPGMELIATAPRTGNPLIVEWFVEYYSRLDTIVISNQGPGLQELLACLTDAEALITPSDSTFFPSVPSGVEVHDGFKMSRRFSASAKLEAISALVEQHSSASVTLTGLGRGGAITLLDALYPSLHLLSTHIIGVTHGMLRVGNQAFPDYIDSVLLDVGRVTSHQDPIPILPRIFLGFHHTSGEKHIRAEIGE
ncbi:hypothetical protein OPQ81_003381 [Rhizoctonia solani]|nr:hypothetical protein OPQ81_003381 [Rhizoctonia solani]